MNYTDLVKKELLIELPFKKHCRYAELAAYIVSFGKIEVDNTDKFRIELYVVNEEIRERILSLLQKCTEKDYTFDEENKLFLCGREAKDIAHETGVYLTTNNEVSLDETKCAKTCCRRSFARASFLCAGFMGDPHRSYQLEIAYKEEGSEKIYREMMEELDYEAKFSSKRGRKIFYLRSSNAIPDFLSAVGANVARLEVENIQIERSINNRVNRQFNCDSGNVSRLMKASEKQRSDINYIISLGKFDDLPDELKETARVRMTYPEASLEELGDSMETKVGKSGVYHRLQRISEFAEDLRLSEGGDL
ncbi:MAG: DNA-binding protein WhiA [Lachnospiraceae bacterium]|nr:DNA-binding protein WhiA [Lachnospiraceae bacterium]